jgi:hypothetical protein
MRLVFAGFILTVLALFPLVADPPNVREKSPDGKWEFAAHWYGNKGYLWELKNLTDGKTYFARVKPDENEALPARIGVLWSLDGRYLAMNNYYGRIVYGVEVIALASIPSDKVQWRPPDEELMIKPEDRKHWDKSGEVNCTATKWEMDDVLVLDLNMRSTLTDKSTGTKYSIDSEKQVSIKFDGSNGKVAQDSSPDYEKVPN